MKIVIIPVVNGALMEIDLEEKGEVVRREIFEYERDDMEEASLSGLCRLLWGVLEHLGEEGSDHDRLRVGIVMCHGSEYECREKMCEICGRKPPEAEA